MVPTTKKTAPKVVIVCDWLTIMGGAELVTLELQKLFPGSPIYTSVYDSSKLKQFNHLNVRTTKLQQTLPKFLRYKHQLWPTFRPGAFKKLDLSEFDIIISASSAEAKAVRKTRPGQVHIAYIHTPIRYYWSHYEEFKNEFNFGALTPFIRPFIPFFVKKMRKKDLDSIPGVDAFIANSTITQKRIKKYYNRSSQVVYPPVNVNRWAPQPKTRRDGYILWGRHVPYKRFDLAIAAANKAGFKLTIVGTGPDTERLKELAGPTVEFTGRISDEELVNRAHHAKAFLFPNEEDFGIAAVEALAAGMPVIAYAKGGALDIVQDGETGVLFYKQTVDDLINAIKKSEEMSFLPATMHRKSKRFDETLFDNKIRKIVADEYSKVTNN
ncbi:glycosyltransferase [Candidatus Saccharibacteria bacterium]|nr:glycosyltransferase [Candidatus Saccharibacteria bacterium]